MVQVVCVCVCVRERERERERERKRVCACLCVYARERPYQYVLAVLDVHKLLKVLRWSLPHGNKLDQNSNSGTRFPKSSLFANPQ